MSGLFVRLHQPRVIGEIVAGIPIGPTLLGGTLAARPDEPGYGLVNELVPFQAFEFLNLIATLALVLFMFLVGIESSNASSAVAAHEPPRVRLADVGGCSSSGRWWCRSEA